MKNQLPTTAAAVAAALGLSPSLPVFNAAGDDERFDETDLAVMSVDELEKRINQHNKLIDAIKNDADQSERQQRRLDEAMQSRAMFQTEIEERPEYNESRAKAEARQRNSEPSSARRAAPNALPAKGDDPAGSKVAANAERSGVVFAAGTREFSAKLFPAIHARSEQVNPVDFFNALATRTYLPAMVQNATATEGIGIDGGFDVPTVWYRGAIDLALQTSEFAQRCRVFTSESNNLVIPMLDTRNRTQGVAGLIANWAAEAEQQTPQVMKWISKEMKLKKTFILSEASSELVEDGIAYAEQLTNGMSLATAQTLDAAILYGTGVGMPLGILNSDSAIEIAKESGQAADSIVWENLVKMYARLSPAAQKRATWFITPDALPSLMAVKVPNTDAPALLSGGFNDAGAGAPAMTIFGRPVVVTEISPTLGDAGDIVLADMSQYGLLMKRGARMENSNAPGFSRDVVSFRMIMRVDGSPLWPSTITPYNGGVTQTWATYLAPRA